MGSRVTILDVMREAGVGIGTVSRVLNNSPHVSQEKRKRVMEVAKRLNYQPHTYAQRLARRQAETISAIIPFFSTYFFATVLHGVQDRSSEFGYDLVLYGVNHVDQMESHISSALQRGKVDGLLFFSMKLPPKTVPRLKESKLPVVLVDTSLPEFDSISVANAEGAYTAVRHLIQLGHRSIGMIGARSVSTPATERLDGYKRALNEQGLVFCEDLVKVGNTIKFDGFNREAGYEAMVEFIKMGSDMPRAFFISSDIQAMGAIAALTENGFSVPEDVAIVGFDDIELAEYFKLTTMRQPMYQMGALAVERLVKRMSSPDMEILHTTFSPTLVVRDSCGALNRSRD
ncbi:MAG TPA: LacI family DNA-binding transcriptional regulator [Candidatus Acidoferrales bacterium]|nr:LacI family DNA-binding transcriptional regulator [Candidatus Acidoferrales bacterium]